ncbi:winged helix-turn-helix domain-containing protein [Cohnella faecalis]|uniref:Winged helix-turn-helix domain-containing protein n=1 Tax=Cohnella faecalis TaxID=2315694 RepID=A0A398CPE2_9BACL|nr:crosslink repair DNA glycosylase YcaQ family protein [Cohnella faecalis]RIE01777.1 winged helix-turn-helix domain-containing protein [Cohnella faecalis]
MAAIMLTKLQARTFLLFYQGLNDGCESMGKEGILSYIRRVGCIQFDPLNVVGMNPELVLQSRIKDFDRSMLWELLYQDRKLIDYWDKNMSIFPLEDWPFFSRCRSSHQAWCHSNKGAIERVYTEIETRGALCSGDLDYEEKVDWAWGPTRLSRAALEGMYHAGHLVIHHKARTRKYYDLAERVIPQDLYALPDPFETDEQYYDWYVLRRIGSVGLLWNRPSDAWLGISGMKSLQRNESFARLLAAKKITEITVEGLQQPLYIRSADLDVLDRALTHASTSTEKQSRILAPLDNLLWDRVLIKELFDFDYRWEVYKPAAERKYGYYVLPVVYGDTIVARFEPVKYQQNAPLSIKNWWWENPSSVNSEMNEGVIRCLERFASFLGTTFQRTDFKW